MKKNLHILSDEIEIPEIVMQKADTAFQKIYLEDNVAMRINEKQKRTTKRYFNSQIAAAIGICLFLLAGTTAFATIRHYWGKGISGTIQATDDQQQKLTEEGIAPIYSEKEDYEDYAVTSGNVTIAPEMVIVDDKTAYISFLIKGYTLEPGIEPDFSTVDVHLADTTDVNMEASFYSELDNQFTDAEGNLEYIVKASACEDTDSLLGKTLCVDLKDLGTVCKTDYTKAISGVWNFEIKLPDVSSKRSITVAQEVPGTDFILNTIEISPISIQLNYTVNSKQVIAEDENGVPDFCGFVLKDGTKLLSVYNGGMTGYTASSMTNAYAISNFNRVIDVDQVSTILIRTMHEADYTEIPIQ